ncbi:MAG: histidine phosphatase family protein [Austwickia sp.]|nr:histidine phosphatase family protein [Austwickia sp.]
MLVRHGVTDSTAAGLLDGRGGLDAPLNAEGTRQAQLMAGAIRAFLGQCHPVVISSTLRRAHQSAQFVAGAFGVGVVVDGDWDELHFGDWNGTSMRELWARDAAGLRALLQDPDSRRPGGESRVDLSVRVARGLEAAVAAGHREGAPVVVLTHRGALVAALAALLGIDVRAAGALDTGPASLTSVRRWSDGEVLVEFVNDRSHLRGE